MDLKNLTLKKESLKNIKENFEGRFIHEEVISVMLLLDQLKKEKEELNYLELGVHNGASFCCAINNTPGISCYGIDLFEDTHDPKHKHSDKINLERTHSNIQKNNRFNNYYELFQGDLKGAASRDFASKIGEVDLLFIDSGHTYQDVQSDFVNFVPFVRSGGFIAFDDYSQVHPGVVRFCDEISDRQADMYNVVGFYNLTGDSRNGTYIIQKK